MGDIEFMDADIHPLAETIFRMVKAGYVKATSVGFLPIEWGWSKDKSRPFGIDFTKQELLEISIVPVPANANALAEARRLGIDLDPLFDWQVDWQAGDTLRRVRRLGMRIKADGSDWTQPDDPQPPTPKGNCGRDKSEPCGMKNPEECTVHLSANKQVKAGRVLSKKNEADLKHAHELIKGVLDQVAADSEDDEPDADDDDAKKARHRLALALKSRFAFEQSELS
jgi:hypothetical protein